MPHYIVTVDDAVIVIQSVAQHQYANCHCDGNATHDCNFSTSQVSTLDYFHPSLSGQGAWAN